MDIFGAMKKKLCHPGIALVCLRAIIGPKVGKDHVLDNFLHPDSKKKHTILFLEYSAEVHYGPN